MRKISNSILGAFIAVFLMAASCKNSEKDSLITIKTPYGDIKAILYDETPLHKENFIKLAKEGFYDSLLFHRVIKEFMIQTGDPNSKNAASGIPLGSGGPGYQIPAEFQKHLIHEKGALSAARTNNPEKKSSGSQFYIVQGKVWTENELTLDMNKLGMAAQQMMSDPQYDSVKQMLISIYEQNGPEAYGNKLIEMKEFICDAMNTQVNKDFPKERMEVYTTIGGSPHLDDEYTVFGKVIEGLNVIDSIAAQPTARGDRPLENIMMIVTVEEMKRKKITKEYGYEYPVATEK
ncbi:MAG: peptidylprolyl isomerase [Cyclobacteriaceae bacterium]|nr:peptidylprolyl isomerase [Cyclobacteriaceae bacterium]